MKILQVGSENAFTLLDVPIPTPEAGEALLRVDAVTTCPQWDLHLRHNDPMFPGHQFHYPYTPGQPGHEATGIIESIGDGVTEFRIGDRVSVWRDPGHKKPGCYAQYVVKPVTDLILVPAKLPVEATASVELAMCVGATFLMLRDRNLLKNRRMGITGLGPAGLIAAQMARAEGATEVIGFDLTPARRAYATERNLVNEAIDSRAVDPERFPSRPGRPTIDYFVDCVGAKASVQFALDHAAEAVALFGVQREDYILSPRHYSVSLCGYPGHSRAAAEYAVDLITQGKLNLAPLVTHHLPLSRYAEGIDLLERQKAIKICFHPWED